MAILLCPPPFLPPELHINRLKQRCHVAPKTATTKTALLHAIERCGTLPWVRLACEEQMEGRFVGVRCPLPPAQNPTWL